MNVVSISNYPNKPETAKIWYDLVDGLRTNLQLKAHRRVWKRHDNCFRGEQAVYCLNDYILHHSPFYRHCIPRIKVVKLLESFRQCGIIVPVNCSVGEFCGGSSLYRFGSEESVRTQMKCPPPELVPFPAHNCVILTPRQIELIYGDICLEYLRGVLDGSKKINLVEDAIIVHDLMDNLHYFDYMTDGDVVSGELGYLVDLHVQQLIKHVSTPHLIGDMIGPMLAVVAAYYGMPACLCPPWLGLIKACVSSGNISAVKIALALLPSKKYRVLQRFVLVMKQMGGPLKCHVNSMVAMNVEGGVIGELLALSPCVWEIPKFIRERVDEVIDSSQNIVWRSV